MKNNDRWFSIGSLSLFFVILASIFLIWYCLGNYFINTYYIGDETKAGQRGDTYGIVNSLFASLAFAGLFYTILLQRFELRQTRAEFEKQNTTFKSQRFENTFFNLMNFHKQTVDGGEQFFVRVKREIQRNIGELDLSSKMTTNFGTTPLELAETRFRQLMHQNFIHYIQKYLQSLTTILNYLFETKLIGDEEKQLFYGILESSLGRNERRILFYHLSLFAEDDTTLKGLLKVEAKRSFVVSLNTAKFHSSHDHVVKEQIARRLSKR
jgi:hypothetical protein